jgi:hypothetical protein
MQTHVKVTISDATSTRTLKSVWHQLQLQAPSPTRSHFQLFIRSKMVPLRQPLRPSKRNIPNPTSSQSFIKLQPVSRQSAIFVFFYTHQAR